MVALTILLSVITIASAAEKEPRHPLSQLTPIDVDLNMSDRSIVNISSIKLNDGTIDGTGLVLDGYTIGDTGSILKLDVSNGYWKFVGGSGDIARFKDNGDVEIPNGNLSVAGTECLSGEYIDGEGNCISDQTISDDQNLSEVLSLGNSAGNENINMNSNAIKNVAGIGASEGYSTHSLTTPDLSSGQWQVLDEFNGQDIIRFKNGGNVEVPNGDIDTNGNDITSSGGRMCIGENC